MPVKQTGGPRLSYLALMPVNEEQLSLAFFKDMQRLARRYYPIVLGHAFGDAEGVLGVSIAFDLENEFVQHVLDSLLEADSLKNIAESTLDVYRTLIGEQAEQGWSTEELKRQILDADKQQSSARAETIARTETARGYSLGSKAAWRESGVVDRMTWLIGPDSCDTCQALDGKIVGIDEEFADGITGPPAHPNCTCALSPVLSSE